MPSKPKILAFAGSLRTDSFNKKLVKIAVQGAQAAGAEVTYIDLRDFPLPIYDGDLESQDGLPENALKLKNLMYQHDGLLISAPEYNSSISGTLKNTLDWISRQASPQEVYLSCFIGKVAALMSASPSALGGLRGLVTLRSILGNIYVHVLPEQKTLAKAEEAFLPDGTLKDLRHSQDVQNLGKKLTEILIKLKN